MYRFSCVQGTVIGSYSFVALVRTAQVKKVLWKVSCLTESYATGIVTPCHKISRVSLADDFMMKNILEIEAYVKRKKAVELYEAGEWEAVKTSLRGAMSRW